MKRFAVFGNPVEHSLSPVIHQAFAHQFGHEICYVKKAVTQANFVTQVRAFFAEGGAGCNVTIPHKQNALAMAMYSHKHAHFAGVANTLWINRQGQICAENTDGIGLVLDLQRLGFPLPNARVLLLGAGGAARGVIAPLLDASVQSITLANRTFAKAQALVAFFRDVRIDCRLFTELKDDYNLIVHATSIQHSLETLAIDTQVFANDPAIYDLNYTISRQPTTFMRQAYQAGCTQCTDGLGMLIYQAAQSYRIWQGVMPVVGEVFNLF